MTREELANLQRTYLSVEDQAIGISNQLSHYASQGHVAAVEDFTAQLARKNEQLERLLDQWRQAVQG